MSAEWRRIIIGAIGVLLIASISAYWWSQGAWARGLAATYVAAYGALVVMIAIWRVGSSQEADQESKKRGAWSSGLGHGRDPRASQEADQ